MRLFAIFRRKKSAETVAPTHDDERATRECATGFEQLQGGQQELALASFDRAIRANPDHFDALQLRGIVALQKGDLGTAISLMQRAVAVNPSNAGVRSNLGLALDSAGYPVEAITSFSEAIRLQPDFIGAYINSSSTKVKLGQLDDALADLMRIDSVAPRSAAVKSALGDLYQRRGQQREAQSCYLEAIELDAQLVGTRINLSQILIDHGEYAAALEQSDAAIALDRSSFEAHLNRALALFKLGRFRESLESSERAIALRPDSCLAYANYGATLEESLRISAALAAYDAALKIDPDNASVHVNKGIALLLTGELPAGWREYDWRWKDSNWLQGKPRFSQARWTGEEPIAGKSILVHNDQGLGDVIQFSRYVPLLVAAGAHVTLEVPEPLVGLFTHASTGATCLRIGEQRPQFDLQTTFSDLPLAFNTNLSSIPEPTHFNITEERISAWSEKLGPKKRPRLGLVWKGNNKHKNDANRSIALDILLPSLPPTIEVISLQNDLTSSESMLIPDGAGVRDFSLELTDFEETAALCSLMDIIVTVDTSVAHLAGSIGKPTWILLPYLPDWRWLLGRLDSPWYESMVLLRQSAPGDWNSVLQELTIRLKSRLLV